MWYKYQAWLLRAHFHCNSHSESINENSMKLEKTDKSLLWIIL